MSGPGWPPTRDDLARALQAGETLAEIARRYGCTPSPIGQWARRYGLETGKPGRRPRPGIDPDELRRLYLEEQLSSREIARKLSAPASTVRDWLRRLRVRTRPAGAGGMRPEVRRRVSALAGVARHEKAERCRIECPFCAWADETTAHEAGGDTWGALSDSWRRHARFRHGIEHEGELDRRVLECRFERATLGPRREREQRAEALRATGATYQQIAHALGVSISTAWRLFDRTRRAGDLERKRKAYRERVSGGES